MNFRRKQYLQNSQTLIQLNSSFHRICHWMWELCRWDWWSGQLHLKQHTKSMRKCSIIQKQQNECFHSPDKEMVIYNESFLCAHFTGAVFIPPSTKAAIFWNSYSILARCLIWLINFYLWYCTVAFFRQQSMFLEKILFSSFVLNFTIRRRQFFDKYYGKTGSGFISFFHISQLI